MAILMEHHKKLTNGVGKCSVPMWTNGCPNGFCNEPAYSEQTEEDRRFREMSNRFLYVPALACPAHGGLEKKVALHLCTYCKNDFAICKSNPTFGLGLGYDNVCECDMFNPKE